MNESYHDTFETPRLPQEEIIKRFLTWMISYEFRCNGRQAWVRCMLTPPHQGDSCSIDLDSKSVTKLLLQVGTELTKSDKKYNPILQDTRDSLRQARRELDTFNL